MTDRERKKLRRHYWAIQFAALLFAGLVGALVNAQFGYNPYVGFAMGWGMLLLIEVFQLRRAGY